MFAIIVASYTFRQAARPDHPTRFLRISPPRRVFTIISRINDGYFSQPSITQEWLSIFSSSRYYNFCVIMIFRSRNSKVNERGIFENKVYRIIFARWKNKRSSWFWILMKIDFAGTRFHAVNIILTIEQHYDEP